MNTHKLISYFKIKQVYGTLPKQIHHICNDSRKVTLGSMFICTRGFTVDGHDFHKQAVDNGAKVIVAEKYIVVDTKKCALIIINDTFKALAHFANKFYGNPSSKLDVIGVTGTNGKTTVTTLIHKLLTAIGESTALSGTIGLDINGEQITTDNTTPDVLTNQQLLAKAVDKEVDTAVLEVSSHGLSQGRLWGIDFDIVAFTNLSQDHLDYHKSMEQYGYIKGLLFAQLGQNLSKAKYLVLNEDDPWFEIYCYWSPYEVISYGIKTEANFKAEQIRYEEDKTTFTLQSPEGQFFIETTLLGEFNVYNILATLATLFTKGKKIANLVNHLKDIPAINGRMEKIAIDAPITMYIDYAHTPDAIEKSIRSVEPFKKHRIIFLVGTGGDRDQYKRPEMAEKASTADYVILTINDPRSEDPNQIVAQMEEGMLHPNYATITDRKLAIKHAIDISKPGDIVIFAGKGQEDYQIVGNKKQSHSDLQIAKEQCIKKYG